LPIEEGLYELVYINSAYDRNDRYVFIFKTLYQVEPEKWKTNLKYNSNSYYFTVKEFDEKEIEHLVSLYEDGYIKIIEKYK